MIDLTKTPDRLGSGFMTGRGAGGVGQKNTIKRLTIKNLNLADSAEREQKYYKDTLDKLGSAIDCILANEALHGFQELYQGCENLVRGKHAEECASLAQDKMRLAMTALQKDLSQRINDLGSPAEIVVAAWKDWRRQVMTIKNILFYLDRTYLNEGRRVTFDQLGLQLFRSQIILSTPLGPRFRGDIGSRCQLDPTGAMWHVDGDEVIRDAIQLLHETGTYRDPFEPEYLSALEVWYAQSGMDAVMADEPIEESLRWIDKVITSGAEQGKTILLESTLRATQRLIDQHVIQPFAERLIEKSPEVFAANDKHVTTLLVKMLARIDRLADLVVTFGEGLHDRGTAIVQGDEQVMVEALLKLKVESDETARCLDEAVAEYYRGKDNTTTVDFAKEGRDQFAKFVNARGDVPAEMMAKYIDAILKTGNRRYSDSELEQQMADLMEIFRFIASKDVFEAFYKKDLAKRLLLNKSASADAERSLLLKLRTECGAGFTQKLEGMFKDIDLSRGFDKAFQNKSLEVMVLSQGSWPTYPEVQVTVPTEMVKALDEFQQFYLKSQTGRKLMWRHSLGHCHIKASFAKGDKELMVSMFQGMVLLCFNESTAALSYEDIKARVGLDDKELVRTLQSLACGKPETRVLLKNSKGKDVSPTDLFKVNDGFSSVKKVVKINQIQLKETAEEQKQTLDQVVQDRSFEIQAAIVRIMKAAKVKTHAELIADTISSIRGRGLPNVGDIKKAIDKLIDREYLSRHGKEYHYEA